MINNKIWNPISHILAPPSMRHSSQTTFQESLGNMTTSQPTAGGNIGITSSTCMVWRIPQWAIPNVQCHPYLVSFLFIPSLYPSFLIWRIFYFLVIILAELYASRAIIADCATHYHVAPRPTFNIHSIAFQYILRCWRYEAPRKPLNRYITRVLFLTFYW